MTSVNQSKLPDASGSSNQSGSSDQSGSAIGNFDKAKLLEQPSYFVKNFIGVDPFDYQKEFLDGDSNKRIFVAGRRVGKSRSTAWLTLWYAVSHPDSQIVITAKAKRQSMELFRKIKNEVDNSPFTRETWGIVDMTATEIEWDNGARIICLPVGRDGSNIRGYEAQLLIVDEASFIPEEIFQEVLSAFVATHNTTFVMTSTPFGKSGYFWKRYDGAPENGWSVTHAASWESPVVRKEWIEQQRNDLTPNQFRQEVKGEFVESSNSYFTREEVVSCAVDGVSPTTDILHLGGDLAHTGDDQSVFIIVDDHGVIFYIKSFDHGLNQAKQQVRYLEKEYDFESIKIDKTGLGEGPVEDLQRQIGSKVEGIQFTRKSKPSIYSTLKNHFQDEALQFEHEPQADRPANEMVDQLTSLEYNYTDSGNIQIQHPSGGHDDYPDALALAVWGMSSKNHLLHDEEGMKPFSMGSYV